MTSCEAWLGRRCWSTCKVSFSRGEGSWRGHGLWREETLQPVRLQVEISSRGAWREKVMQFFLRGEAVVC